MSFRRKKTSTPSLKGDVSDSGDNIKCKKKEEKKKEAKEGENGGLSFLDKLINSSPQKSFEDDIETLGREIGAENYQVISLLGVGSQGRVYLVRLTSTDQYFALKVFRKDRVLPNEKVCSYKVTKRQKMTKIRFFKDYSLHPHRA